MRLDMIGLRTWLLATVVGWALLVCVLAVAGLGKRVELLPDDPALVQRLPTLPAPAPERLGAFEKYSEIAAHPAFAEDRLPHPFFLSGNDGGNAASTVRLTGVLLTDNFKMATLTLDPQDSVRVQLGGEAVKGWRLLALQPRSATVEGPSGTQTLELHVFNGQGGQPPTANAAARVPPLPPRRYRPRRCRTCPAAAAATATCRAGTTARRAGTANRAAAAQRWRAGSTTPLRRSDACHPRTHRSPTPPAATAAPERLYPGQTQ